MERNESGVLFSNQEREIDYAKGPLPAYFAMRLWHEEGVSIFGASEEFNVTPDDIMESFRANKPLAYYPFMAKLHFALGMATILAAFHSHLKNLRDAIERSIS